MPQTKRYLMLQNLSIPLPIQQMCKTLINTLMPGTGVHGGRFVSETLMAALEELETLYTKIKADPAFWEEYHNDLVNYVGRPTPLYHAKRLSDEIDGAQIYFKREDLNHTGAHKVNNTIGQALLAKMCGKRIIAETGRTAAWRQRQLPRVWAECIVYMGADDVGRQKMNVYHVPAWCDSGASDVWLAHSRTR